MKKAVQIKAELQHFHRTEMFYQIPLIQTRFTDGLKYLANAADCYWLITDSSLMAKSLLSKSEFITIDFKRLPNVMKEKNGYEAVLIYSDGNDTILKEQGYRYTDFPLNELRLFFVDNTLMLPSEY